MQIEESLTSFCDNIKPVIIYFEILITTIRPMCGFITKLSIVYKYILCYFDANY